MTVYFVLDYLEKGVLFCFYIDINNGGIFFLIFIFKININNRTLTFIHEARLSNIRVPTHQQGSSIRINTGQPT